MNAISNVPQAYIPTNTANIGQTPETSVKIGKTEEAPSVVSEDKLDGIDFSSQPSKSKETRETAQTSSIQNSDQISGQTKKLSCDSLSTAGKAAASCITGTAGAVVGEAMESLKDYQEEIEKGYHLPEKFICGYYDRRIFPYLDRPNYSKSDEYMYRGMYITVDELANILRNGFETKFNTWSAVGGKGIYLTSSIHEADDYIFQSVDFKKKNALGVVFKLHPGDYAKLVEDPKYNSTNTIYKSDADVPPDKIADIYLRGEYGLESLGSIIEKAKNGEIKDNSKWTSQFDSYMMR